MKLIKTVLVIMMFVFVNKANGQVINKTSHVVEVQISEVALIALYDSENLAKELEPTDIINLNLADRIGASEAGFYSFSGISRTGLWLNYTSVVGTTQSGFDTVRTIDVKMMPNSFGDIFPKSVDLLIKPGNVLITNNGGDPGFPVEDVRLGETNAIGTNARLVNNIGSVHTGVGAKGLPLTYSLVQNGDFADYKAGSYSAIIEYTLSDL